MEWLSIEDALKEAQNIVTTIIVEIHRMTKPSFHVIEVHGINQYKTLVLHLNKLVDTKKIISYTTQNVNDLQPVLVDDFIKKVKK